MASMGLGVEVAYEKKGFRYDKILICTDEKSRRKNFFRRSTKTLYLWTDRKACTNVSRRDIQGHGGEVMRHHLELSMDQVYVFGDSGNDLSMFEYAKHTVAMGEHDRY